MSNDILLIRLANMRLDKDRVIQVISTDREKQGVVLNTLSSGIGARQLVEHYNEILEACDDDLLEEWLAKFPTSKVGNFEMGDKRPGPKLDAAITKVLTDRAVKAMAAQDVFEKWTALAEASTDGTITVELRDMRTVLDLEG